MLIEMILVILLQKLLHQDRGVVTIQVTLIIARVLRKVHPVFKKKNSSVGMIG